MKLVKGHLLRKLKRVVKSIIHIIYRFYRQKRIIESKKHITIIKAKRQHVFFGYYDLTPFNSKDEIVYLKINKNNTAEINFQPSHESKEIRPIATTKAWNWQQGARLRWFPGSDEKIIFNDHNNHHYCSRIIDIKSLNEKIIDYPLYDISSDGAFGLTLNFEKLGVMRPGYGYPTINPKEITDHLNDGIDLIDLQKNTSARIISFGEMAELLNIQSKSLANNYINHISISPSGEQFLFFWLSKTHNYHHASLFTYNLKSHKLYPVETAEKVSHYAWIDDNNILATVYHNQNKCNYYIYNLLTIEKILILPDSLNRDGHPIVINPNEIVTDTYPDKWGYQKLLHMNIEKDLMVDNILNIYSTPLLTGEKRTDLHPRFNVDKSIICIDSNPKKFRQMVFIK